eukprot:TRINITY_DN3463_c0_g1_i1.p1 TRINITY_DN3463_c0_g1~~TRINITY_DN3463_c0_g1_i1.p1  ORF type:complete len:679 (+),score=206.49 TRINITY_DN3463_c0_g1_i1:77-2113(+)
MLTGMVLQARNLVGKNQVRYDPYVVVGQADENGRFSGKKKLRSKSKPVKRNLNPDWNFSFELFLDNPAFKVEVLDAASGTEEFMGQVTFIGIDKECEGEGWYRLQPRPGREEIAGGEIQLIWKFKMKVTKGPALRFDIFLHLIKWIEEKAIETEGIFRLSGSDKEVKALYMQFSDPTKVPTIDDESDPHVVSGALKLYLRDTSTTLIPAQSYTSWVESYAKEVGLQENAAQIRKAIDSLPSTHRNILVILMGFLHRVSLHRDTNKMTPSNLGIVFGPTIVIDNVNTTVGANNLNVAAKESAIVEFLIENFYQIFDRNEEYKVKELEEAINKKNAEEKKKLKAFTVFFPGGKKTVPYEAYSNKKLRPLIEKICIASSLSFTEYSLSDEHGNEINLDTELKDISGMSVTMRVKEERRNRRSMIITKTEVDMAMEKLEKLEKVSPISKSPKTRSVKTPKKDSSSVEATTTQASKTKTFIASSTLKMDRKSSKVGLASSLNEADMVPDVVKKFEAKLDEQTKKIEELTEKVLALEALNKSKNDKLNETFNIVKRLEQQNILLMKRLDIKVTEVDKRQQFSKATTKNFYNSPHEKSEEDPTKEKLSPSKSLLFTSAPEVPVIEGSESETRTENVEEKNSDEPEKERPGTGNNVSGTVFQFSTKDCDKQDGEEQTESEEDASSN